MKRIFWGMVLFVTSSVVRAQVPIPVTPVPVNTPIPVWNVSKVPWDSWFKDNVKISDKTEWVYFFWNAQEYKANFEVKDKQKHLAEAAIQMTKLLFPSDAKADQIKVDIVYVPELDRYGKPDWSSRQKVAHLEFLRSEALKLAQKKKNLSAADLKKIFTQLEIY